LKSLRLTFAEADLELLSPLEEPRESIEDLVRASLVHSAEQLVDEEVPDVGDDGQRSGSGLSIEGGGVPVKVDGLTVTDVVVPDESPLWQGMRRS